MVWITSCRSIFWSCHPFRKTKKQQQQTKQNKTKQNKTKTTIFVRRWTVAFFAITCCLTLTKSARKNCHQKCFQNGRKDMVVWKNRTQVNKHTFVTGKKSPQQNLKIPSIRQLTSNIFIFKHMFRRERRIYTESTWKRTAYRLCFWNRVVKCLQGGEML